MTAVLLTNILTPYRRFFYDELYKEFKRNNIEFRVVVMTETEPNRNWKYAEFKSDYTILLQHRTVTVGGIFIHLNKGLRNLYEQLMPTVVICAGSYMYPALWETLHLERKLGYKTMYWSESHLSEVRDYGNVKLKIREFMRKTIISRFDGFWYAGKFSKEFINKYAKPSAEYVFVPNLVNISKFSRAKQKNEIEKKDIKKKYSLPEDKRILMTPARLSKVKGIMEFLRLYKDVDNRINAIYLIVGDGELDKEIREYCKKFNLDVRLLGYKQEVEMLDLYAISDVFVLPSLSDPNPLTCIEACWCGLPLLVSRHVGNYPEIVKEDSNGYVFSYEEPDIAKEKIKKMLANDHQWIMNASLNSFKVASELYDPHKSIKRIVSETISQGEI